MKNRIWTDALREVRGTLGRFFSLLLLSALAVAFLAGLRTTAPDMELSADRYYDGQGLMDLRVLSTLGLTEADIDALGAQPGVAAAEGAYTIDAIAAGADNDFIVKALSLSDAGINRPRLAEGRLPERGGECLVEPKLLSMMGLQIGDVLPLDTGTEAFENALKYSAFTIVGTADSPLYLSADRGSSSLGSGRVSAFVLLPRTAFQMEAYTDAYLLAEGAEELLCYGGGYEELMEGLTGRLEPLGTERERGRYDQVVGEATETLNEAQGEFDDAQAEADQKLGEARDTLADARRALDQGWSDYTGGKASYERAIADAERRIAQAENVDLPDALRVLEEGEADYAQGAKKLQDAWSDYENGLKEYQSGLGDYREGYDELIDQDETYNESLQRLRDGEAEYAAGFQRYGHGLDRLQDGGKQIQENERKLSDALDQLFAGQQALSAGRAELGDLQTAYGQLSGAYAALTGGLAAGGLSDGDPQVMGGLLAGALGAELASTGSCDGFFGSYVAPLAALLGAERAVAAQAGQDTAQLDALLGALPADGAALAGAFLAAPEDTVSGYLTALGAAGAVLDAMGGQLAGAGGQLDAAESQLAWGQMEYDQGRAQLNEAKKTFYSSADELKEAGATLAESRRTLDDGWEKLREGEAKLDEAWTTLNAARLDLNGAQTTLDDAWQQLQDAQQKLIDARRALDDGWAEYERGQANLDQVKAALAEERPKGAKRLADALRDLEEGEAEYAAGLADYQQAKAEADEQLSAARRELNDARRAIAEIEDCKWYFLGRGTNMGYVSFQNDAQRMGNLASVFPLIFFLVAALVCLTTMTRMVEEHRVQIGGLKAMGYGPGAVSVKYVGYGLAASLAGGLLGLGFGCTVIPMVIYNAWSIIYTMGPLVIPFYPGISLFAVAAAVLTVAGAAFLTCRSVLGEVPAALMRPKAPKSGKRVLLERVGFLWRRLSFSHKVTVRNLFRYKRRFWMTVVGIGGCTALIVTGFGLRDAIFTIMDKQYDELLRYTSQIGLVDNVTADERAELYRALDKSGEVIEYRGARQENLSVEGAPRAMDAVLLTAGADGLGDFITLRGRRDQSPVTLPGEGAVLTEKLAKLLEVGVGDSVTLDGEARVSVTVAGITEHYIGHYVYLSAAAYEALYGAPVEENVILARYSEDSQAVSDAVSGRLIPLAGVTSVSRVTDTRQTYQHSMESVDYAVVVIIIAAAALAFVVLFNLTNINITERMRELATLKVLGFHDGELAAYVFRENALLTLFGVALGLVLGKFLHQWLVLTVEIDMLMFYRTAKPLSYGLAAALTVLFSITVNLVAGRKLRKIDMVESLKTVE